MPSVAGEASAVAATDMGAYFTGGAFLADLARMTALRDELAKRQGAMSAVESAHADRAKAANLAERAEKTLQRAEAEARAVLDQAKARETAAAEAGARLAADSIAFADASATARAEAEGREKAVTVRETAVSVREDAVSAGQAQLAADRAALEARINDFQVKVAALTQ